jgi:hypothetical protein
MIYPNLFLADVYKSYQKLTLEIIRKPTYLVKVPFFPLIPFHLKIFFFPRNVLFFSCSVDWKLRWLSFLSVLSVFVDFPYWMRLGVRYHCYYLYSVVCQQICVRAKFKYVGETKKCDDRRDKRTNGQQKSYIPQSFFGGCIQILSKINIRNFKKTYISCPTHLNFAHTGVFISEL